LPISSTGREGISAWATRAPDATIRVVVINRTNRPATFEIPASAGPETATVVRLTAPHISARTQISLGGEGFGASTQNGVLADPPHSTQLPVTSGSYRFTTAAFSAVMLAVPSR